MMMLRECQAGLVTRQSCKTAGLEILQNINTQLADEELVLPVREVLKPAEQQLVLRQRLRLQVVTRIEVARDAILQLRAVDRLILTRGTERTELRLGRRPVAQAERLARVFLRVDAPGQPYRTVAIGEKYLL